MYELFTDMQKKGLITVEKPRAYSFSAKDFDELVSIYDNTVLLKLWNVEQSDLTHAPDFVVGNLPDHNNIIEEELLKDRRN